MEHLLKSSGTHYTGEIDLMDEVEKRGQLIRILKTL
jgi:hypothetical protein